MNISDLQNNIKTHDFDKDNPQGYFLKLIEEVGELSEAIRKSQKAFSGIPEFKGSVAEELTDVLYYVCALANVHEVDLEGAYLVKEQLNKERYGR